MQAFYRPTDHRRKVVPDGRPIERVNLKHGFGVRRFGTTMKEEKWAPRSQANRSWDWCTRRHRTGSRHQSGRKRRAPDHSLQPKRDEAETLLDHISGQGFIVHADLSQPEEAQMLWRRAQDCAGDIYGLVNNAGVRSEVSVDADRTEWAATWEKEFRINFFAAADLCKEAIRHFISGAAAFR